MKHASSAPRALPVLLFVLALVTLAWTATGCDATADDTTPIPAIQGAGHRSPLAGERVVTTGVVTRVLDDGFFLQDPEGDDDPRTSDAVRVFEGATRAEVGQRLRIGGTVSEWRPGGNETNLTVTTLRDARIEILDEDVALPTPVVLGRDGRMPPTTVVDDDELEEYQPTHDGIDFYESLEAMRVRVDDAVAVSATSRYAEVWVLADGGAGATGLNDRGGITLTEGDDNPERIQIQFPSRDVAPAVGMGDRLGTLVGPLNYAFGNYEVLVARRPEVRRAETGPDVTSLRASDGTITVGTFNVLNLGGDAEPEAFAARARVIVERMGAPAIVALQEIQDDDGATDSGDPSADRTFRRLIEAIVDVDGPRYAYAQIDPVDGADGGQPGGNIRVGFLYDEARVTLPHRGEAGPLDAVRVVDGPHFEPNPARVDPEAACFDDSRKPLAAEFVVDGTPLFVIDVHFSSKGGSTPLFGAVQPPVNGREEARREQARRVLALVEAIRAEDRRARIVVLGDFNEFAFEEPMRALVAGGALENLMLELEPTARFTYVYQGNSQALDHVLVGAGGFRSTELDVIHGNAGFRGGASDHDAIVVRLGL